MSERGRRIMHGGAVHVVAPGASWTGRAVNVSSGGAFLTGGPPLEVGRRLTLTMDLGDGQPPIEVHAKIAWRRASADAELQAGFGVRFVRMDDAAQRRLDTLIASHTLLPHEVLDEPMRVRLPGLTSRLKVHARELSGRNLVVEADLPWLPIGANVATELAPGQVRDGRLVWVGVEVGPMGFAQLTLNIELSEEPSIDIEMEADYEAETTQPLH